MTDANTAALDAELERMERSARRYSELKTEARDRITERFYGDSSYFAEQMAEYAPDVLLEMIVKHPRDFWLARGDASVAQSLLCSLVNSVFSDMEEHEVEREIGRLDN